ncbi:MAG: aldose 1-epimerase family protein [Oscillospiraceae bacterium]|nr:aldose 1-epimerase family protein [Oscillospiraceae bacterium]
MSINVIETSALRVSIADAGAELISAVDKESGNERIWNADPAVWNRHSPILFPFVGRVTNGAYRVNGKEYMMKTQHGFARDMVFSCIEKSDSTVVHCLCSSKETLHIYPFPFILTIRHSVSEMTPRQLFVEWTIENPGTETMLYSIGGHPGFLIPEGIRKEDCGFLFPGKSELFYFNANESGYATPWNQHSLILKDAFTPYQSDVPETWIFEDQRIDSVTIVMPDRRPYVTMECGSFPMFAIWANRKGPFICLEPWFGRTDNEGFQGILQEKKGIERLEPGEKKSISYQICFHKFA